MAKQTRKRKHIIFTQGVSATKERQRHDGGVVTEVIYEKSDGKVYTRRHRTLFPCILNAYLDHGRITPTQYEAAMRFGKEYLRSVRKVKVDDGGAGCHGDVEMPLISAINGNRMLREAFEVLSHKQLTIMVTVCVDNYRAGGTRELHILCTALQILVELWKIK